RRDLPTGRAWSAAPSSRARRKSSQFLRVRGARANNLDAVDVAIPLGVVCAITGPSGSGKSTLAEEIVYRGVARALGDSGVERQFLADVALLCPVCQGKRFKPEVLAVKHRGLSVADVLAMTVEEALALLDPSDGSAPRDYVLRRALDPVVRVGLGYLPLGQPL